MIETGSERLVILQETKLESNFARDVLQCLSERPMRLSSMYFYDEEGSRLFEEIMKLDEYYLTNCEWEIFDTYKADILKIVGKKHFNLVDIGVGDAKKTRVLISHFLESGASFTYTPVDISQDILEQLVEELAREYPTLKVKAVVAEYFDALSWLKGQEESHKLVLFMGSNIGNFRKKEVSVFLQKIQKFLLRDDYFLIGIDLKKDPHVILSAYDDSKGVTAAFNYNLLRRINTELGGNFNLEYWRHYPTYDPQTGEVESYLVSTREQDVYIRELNRTFHIGAYEAIHTEYSCKYTPEEIGKLASECGFDVIKKFYDSRKYFTDSLWKARILD